ncbi:cupin domain-containing protein [Halorubrum vacuolatum]|uniref:Cupin domain protein n=1 Tax=Halorubrum vacuolatum TaxID=63740 RepID=A0A238WE76_HALVU|nr:cupin domain-containing protein [Halorubrum vacuolatum]SNR44855.1 Cupin domain protein [Halorubrum vacuolatum]
MTEPSNIEPAAVIKRGDDIDYEPVGAAEGLTKGVLIDAADGAPNFAIRRFELAPGASVPRHTNAVEHEQYVLAGEYVVGIDEEEYTVSAGDSLLIPAGVEHWYRNEHDEPGAFLCAVPNGDDEIELVE